MWKKGYPAAYSAALLVLCGVFPGDFVSSAEDSMMFTLRGVRYQVKDVDRAVSFYTRKLGFELDFQVGKAFASVSIGGANLLLSGPGSSGARPLPDGREQGPGGWNRIVLEVADLDACVAALQAGDVRFRNTVETGPGGKQIQIEDPDGNPIEIFEPAAR